MIISKLNQFCHKHGKIALGFILVVIAVPFIFMDFAGSGRGGNRLTSVGNIFGEDISIEEFSEFFTSKTGQAFDPSNQMTQMYMSWIMNDYINVKKAMKEGLDKNINNSEIIDILMSSLGDQVTTDGKFDYAKYSSLNEGARVFYERRAKNQIMVQRLQNKYKNQAVVTDAEIEAGYKADNLAYTVDALVFKNADFESKVSVDAAEIKKYFDENKTEFEIPEQMVVSYVTFLGSDYTNAVKVDEASVKEKYEAARRVKASHILIDVAATATEEEKEAAKAKATTVLADVKKGEKSFGELAKEYSACPSKEKDGDLDWFTHKSMVPEFSNAAFALKKDEVSELVKTQFGYHIIKATDVEDSYDALSAEKKSELNKEMAKERASELAGNAAYKFSTEVYNAVSNSKEANLTALNFFETRARVAKKAIKKTKPFVAGSREAVEGISSLKFATDVKLLSKENPISEAIKGDADAYYVACFIETVPAHIPAFAEATEAKEKIKTKLIAEKAEVKSQEKATAAFEQIRKLKAEGKSVDAIAKEMKMTSLPSFKAKDPAPSSLTAGSDVKMALKDHKVGDVIGPKKGFTGYDVVIVRKITEASDEDFKKDQETYSAAFRTRKENEAWNAASGKIREEAQLKYYPPFGSEK